MLRSCCLTANIGKYCLCSRRLFFLANSLRASVFSFMCSANFCSALEHQGENMNKTCCHNSHAKTVCWANTWRLHTCSPLCHPLQQACLHRYLLPPSSLCPWCPPALCQPVPSVYAEPEDIIWAINMQSTKLKSAMTFIFLIGMILCAIFISRKKLNSHLHRAQTPFKSLLIIIIF